MKHLTTVDLLSIHGGINISKECEKLMDEIVNNWEYWDKPKQDSKIEEWNEKCSS